MPQFRTVATTDDAAVTLLAEYFQGRAQTFPGGPAAYKTTFPLAEDFEPPRGVFLILSDVPGDIGCGGIRSVPSTTAGTVRYEVKHLYVRAPARGTGLGRAVLEELERRAAAFGGTEVVLDTNASQVSAGMLYQRSGYSEIEPYNDNPNATHWYLKLLA
ncbi:MAG: PadR family transcriptional regulator [Homoserinimonas sp.]|jgi:GNAT superfamily N-acetyltransferase|nr:PadR family transcriptional regulator [Homoserinimonas sp.]